MLRPSVLNILLYIFTKYLLFFILLACLDNRFTSIVIRNSNSNAQLLSNSLYYLLCILFYILIVLILFSAPTYLAFKVKRGLLFVPITLAILACEYFFYTYAASQTDRHAGLYESAFSVLVLCLFFYKQIRSLRWR